MPPKQSYKSEGTETRHVYVLFVFKKRPAVTQENDALQELVHKLLPSICLLYSTFVVHGATKRLGTTTGRNAFCSLDLMAKQKKE